MVEPLQLPLTDEKLQEAYRNIFAPWVQALGLTKISVEKGHAYAFLPQSPALKYSSGAICGQAIMSAVDTVISLAMLTSGKRVRGTVYQHTHFLRPALNDDLHIHANVLRFGNATAYGEAKVTFATSGKLVAHATAEFALEASA